MLFGGQDGNSVKGSSVIVDYLSVGLRNEHGKIGFVDRIPRLDSGRSTMINDFTRLDLEELYTLGLHCV
jgi:hypothetical protein